MSNNSGSKTAIHIKSFWAITIIAVVAAVLGGIIYFYTQGNELNDDIYSISFSSPVQVHYLTKKPTKPLPKTVQKTTTTGSSVPAK